VIHRSHDRGGDVRLESLIKAGKDATAGGEAWAFEPLGGTTPHGGATSPIRYTEGGEQKRDAVNRWIRSSGAYDGVIDADLASPR